MLYVVCGGLIALGAIIIAVLWYVDHKGWLR